MIPPRIEHMMPFTIAAEVPIWLRLHHVCRGAEREHVSRISHSKREAQTITRINFRLAH